MLRTYRDLTLTARSLVCAASILAPVLAHGSRSEPPAVTATLSEWKVQLSSETVPAGTVTFEVSNTGSVPHALEVEGHGMEKQTAIVQPGKTTSLTITLEPGTYELYCPVGDDSHKKLGMETHLKVVGEG